MRAYPISLSPTAVTTTATATATRFLLNPSPIFNKTTTFLFLSTPCPPHRLLFSKFRHTPFCSSNSNVTSSNISEDDDDDVYFEDDDNDDDDGFVLSDKKTQSLSEDGVFIEIDPFSALRLGETSLSCSSMPWLSLYKFIASSAND